MKKKIIFLLLSTALLISGCGRTGSAPAGAAADQTSGSSQDTAEAASESDAPDSSEGVSDDSAATSDPESSEAPSEDEAQAADPDIAGTASEEGPEEPAAEPSDSEADSGPVETPAEPAQAGYTFNPHLYVPIFADDIPQDYWDSFYNLCDALRAGETTFACSSAEACKWALDPVTLNTLFPTACMKIREKDEDGNTPFENGVGRIYYEIPIDEFTERQAGFESLVEDVLNTWLEADDDEFEKALKLYDYMESTYDYQYDFLEELPDGANYYTIMTGSGQCVDLGNVYAYFLLEAGVQAVESGCSVPEMAHDWTYIVIDGKGYFSDPTWSLKSTLGSEDLALYYFLMTGDRRADSGCPVDDLTSPLLPRYWVNFSTVRLEATDDSLSFPEGSVLDSIDEDNKLVRYILDDEVYELNYGQG